MKSQRGVTITSLVIYIVLIFFILAILATVTANFQSGIKEINQEGTQSAEINKFNVYFLQEVKKQGNSISEISQNKIAFTTGNIYIYRGNSIYLEKEGASSIQIAENINKCIFSNSIENGKNIIKVTIQADETEEQTIEYILSNEQISYNYEDEDSYTKDFGEELLRKYILGESGEGRVVTEIIGIPDPYAWIEFVDDENSMPNANSEVIFLNMNPEEEELAIYLKYNNKAYKFSYDDSTSITKDLNQIYTPKGREGEIVQYDSDGDGTKEEWTIIYDDGTNIEIISNKVMGSLTLGCDDEIAANLTEDLNGDGVVDNIDKGIYSYDNAIERINAYCRQLVTATDNEGVRSIGAEKDNSGYYMSSTFHEWYTGANKNAIKDKDSSYEKDLIRANFWEQTNNGQLGIGENYWIASRLVNEGDYVNFHMRYSAYGMISVKRMWRAYSNGKFDAGYTGGNNLILGVRPIIKNPQL